MILISDGLMELKPRDKYGPSDEEIVRRVVALDEGTPSRVIAELKSLIDGGERAPIDDCLAVAFRVP